MPEEHIDYNSRFFADFLSEDEDFELINNLQDQELNSFATACKLSVKHPVMYERDKGEK